MALIAGTNAAITFMAMGSMNIAAKSRGVRAMGSIIDDDVAAAAPLATLPGPPKAGPINDDGLGKTLTMAMSSAVPITEPITAIIAASIIRSSGIDLPLKPLPSLSRTP